MDIRQQSECGILCFSYDVILTSETIYNIGNYGKLLKLFDHALKPQGIMWVDGFSIWKSIVVFARVKMIGSFFLKRYLAAKVYYFGVQGGIRQFEEFITKTGLFNTRVGRVIDASKKESCILYVCILLFLRC